jgi:hypothetical protein
MNDILIEKTLEVKENDSNKLNVVLVWSNIILHFIILICTVYTIYNLNI